MLSELQIRDFAIVDRLFLNFQSGMSVFTGETGAGKSIAIDALGIALGDRAESSVVRSSARRAEISASFDITLNPQATQWLIDNELDEDGECILRRTINKEGGSKAYINGRPVPLQRIRELAELLIDIHSQHQHQSLLRPNEQRNLLDQYGQSFELARKVRQAFNQWKKACRAKEEMLEAEKDRQSRVAFLQFQLDEFEKLAATDGEWKKIEQEHMAMANLEKIEAATSDALNALYDGNNSALNQINHAVTVLQKVSSFNDSIASSIELLNTAQVNIEESVNDIRSVTDDSQWDQARFNWLEERMSSYVGLAKKHNCGPQELITTQDGLQQEFDNLTDADATIEKLDAEIASLRSDYQQLADQLSQSRKKSSEKLGKEVSKILATLGMKGATFTPELLTSNEALPSANGNENISFNVCTNKGQTAQAIQKVASGGELSRISLAIQVVTAKVAHIPSMVFDEVDVGIGGGTAEVVGKLLRQLGKTRQIICITHQPQVAAQGHHHYLVSKSSTKTETTTKFTTLSGDERKQEVARMLGGVTLTNTTLEHAQEMLDMAEA